MSAHSLTLENLSFGSLLSASWQIFKSQWKKLLLVILAVVVLQVITSAVQSSLASNSQEGLAALVSFIGSILSAITSMGMLFVFIKAARGENIELSDVFSKYNRFFPYFFSSIITSVIVLFGLILLVVPGMIWAIKYVFVPYLILDTDKGVFGSLEASGKMTQGYKLRLFFNSLGFVGVNILGMLALLVGIIITVPVTTIAGAILYDVLKSRLGESAPAVTTITAAPGATVSVTVTQS